MTITAWRMVSRGRGLDQAFSGEGARLFGGRWNSPGIPVVYTSESVALATLETCVHIDRDVDMGRYMIFPVRFESELVTRLEQIPENWDHDPIPPQAMAAGDQWAKKSSSPVLKVPSVIVPWEFNYVLNPLHPEFSRIRIGPARPFFMDKRLIQIH